MIAQNLRQRYYIWLYIVFLCTSNHIETKFDISDFRVYSGNPAYPFRFRAQDLAYQFPETDLMIN